MLAPSCDHDAIEMVKDHLVIGSRRISSRWIAAVAGPAPDGHDATRSTWTDGAEQRTLGTDPGGIRSARHDLAAGALQIEWESGTTSVVPCTHLLRAYDVDPVAAVAPRTWGAGDDLPRHDLAEVLHGDGARALLRDLVAWRAVVVDRAGSEPDAGRNLLDALATPCHTHTGPGFVLRPSDAPSHLGQTCGPIEVHTDMAYRQTPPTLQVLHSLVPAADGGTTTLVDGRRLVDDLPPDVVEVLRTSPVDFVARSASVDLRARHHVVDRTPDGGVVVTYNDRKLVVPCDADVVLWDSLDAFARILVQPGRAMHARLGAGSILVFDNRCVLHGRTAFTDRRRLLHGWYANIDDALARYRRLVR